MNKNIIILSKVLYYEEVYYAAVMKNYYLKLDMVDILEEVGAEVIGWDDTILITEASLFHLELHLPNLNFEVLPDA